MNKKHPTLTPEELDAWTLPEPTAQDILRAEELGQQLSPHNSIDPHPKLRVQIHKYPVRTSTMTRIP